MEKDKINYYSDELNDEFSGIVRDTIRIDGSYRYLHHNPLWHIGAFLTYRVIMTPVAALYMKLKFKMKIVNRSALLQCRKDAFFLYGNHTQVPGDGYIPTVLTFPKKDIVVVNADNVSMPGTRTFMEMIGAYPLPHDREGMVHFMNGLKHYIGRKKSIVIYPEAHIWPYYIGIRPYSDASFAYPVMYHKPAYSFTVTYQRFRHSGRPKITVYVDGPLYPKEGVRRKEAQLELRNRVYEKMMERSKESTYEYIKYRKKEEIS